MPNYAQAERQALCDTALRIGPDAPTLCDGWTVKDLLAHLAMRERRPEAVGILLPQARDLAERTRARYALRPFEDLVDMVRRGPHEFSPFRIPAVDARRISSWWMKYSCRFARAAALRRRVAGAHRR